MVQLGYYRRLLSELTYTYLLDTYKNYEVVKVN